MNVFCFLWAFARVQLHGIYWGVRDFRKDHRTVSIVGPGFKCVHLECMCGKVFWTRPEAEPHLLHTRVIFNMGAKADDGSERARRAAEN